MTDGCCSWSAAAAAATATTTAVLVVGDNVVPPERTALVPRGWLSKDHPQGGCVERHDESQQESGTIDRETSGAFAVGRRNDGTPSIPLPLFFVW